MLDRTSCLSARRLGNLAFKQPAVCLRGRLFESSPPRCPVRSVLARSAATYHQGQRGRPETPLLRANADPGSWAFSPEWMGSQAGGWGHNLGEVVFSAQSRHGNGRVWVTKHFASKEDASPWPNREGSGMAAPKLQGRYQEWRVLRFNEETRQSVARVEVGRDEAGDEAILQRPDCMAFLYMKTLACAVASLVGLAPEGSTLAAASGDLSEQRVGNGSSQRCRALCVGLGGGSLPLFLTHHFPGMEIDVVELDPVVVAAAEAGMGFPRERPRLRVHEGDAIRWVREHHAAGGYKFDLAFVDAFDGENQIPTPFTDPGGPFLSVLAAVLDPDHGAALLNVHRGELPPLWKQIAFKLAGKQWMDPFVTPIACTYRQVCLTGLPGRAFMLGVGKQYNTVVVAARGRHLEEAEDFPEGLRKGAEAIATRAHFRFDAAERSVMDLTYVDDEA